MWKRLNMAIIRRKTCQKFVSQHIFAITYRALQVSLFWQVVNTVPANMLTKRVLRKSQRSEEHTSELQSRENLVCRLLLEKKNNQLQSIKIEFLMVTQILFNLIFILLR